MVQNGAVFGAPHLSLSCDLGFRHVWIYLWSYGEVTRGLFTGVKEELPETEHVLRERIKPSKLEPETETKS